MSSKNEQYEISGCELEFLNGTYTYSTKLESHVHQSGKFHLLRTNKDYIWMITDATRRKQYCFAQKIAPFPTMCNWNVFTGGDGVKGELIASSMRAVVTSEPSTVSPPKRSLSNHSNSKLSPLGSSQSSAKWDNGKKSSTKAEDSSPLSAKTRPVTSNNKKVSAGASPVPTNSSNIAPKPTPEATSVQARQVIANAAANILSGNKGATVVRRSESFKINPVVQEAETNSLEVSPVASPSTTPSKPAGDMNVLILLVPSLEDGFLQVTAPVEVTRNLSDRETMSTPHLTDLRAIATTWADTTVQMDREVARAHQRVHELEQEVAAMHQGQEDLSSLLQQRTTELETLRESFEKSQEQAQAAQEALREAVAQAKLMQDEIALEREGSAQERARHAEDEAAAAQVRAQTALETAKSVQAQVEAMRAELDATEARAQAMHEEADRNEEQLSLALKRAHLAETLERDTQQQLQVARSQVQELQVALDLASYAAEPMEMPTFEVSTFSERSAQLRIEELESLVENMQAALDKSLTLHTINSQSSADSAAAALEMRADAAAESVESARYIGELETLVNEKSSQLQTSADQMKVNSDKADIDRVENARYVDELETLVNEKSSQLQTSADQMKVNSDKADTDRVENARYVDELETLVNEKSNQLQTSADQMKVNSDKADIDRVENARYVGELETLVNEKSSQLQTSADQMKVNSDKADTDRVESARYVDELETLVSEKSTQLKTSAHKLKESSQRADTLVARSGKRHMKRGTESKLRAEFPNGEDFRCLFVSDLANFETFACDAVNCLQDLGHPDDAAEVLVNEILVPIFNVCHKYVHDKLETKRALFKTEWGVEVNTDAVDDTADKLFWFTSMQPWLLSTIDAMDNTTLMALVRSMGLAVTDLHCSMVTAGTAGLIDNSEGALRIPALAHVLLRCFTISALSDPKCYLYPAPGRRVPYKKAYTEDILGLGTNQHGPVDEGEEVEVVLCGLYFDNPEENESDFVKPIVPALVRRLPSSKK